MFRKSLLMVMGVLVMFLVLPTFAQAASSTVDLDYVDADIRSVCTDLVAQLEEKGVDVNIVVGPNVEGYVTLGPTEISLEKALDMICASGGFRYIQIEKYYIVMVPDPDNPLFLKCIQNEIVYLSYASARNIVKLLKPYTAYLQADERDRSIMITALPGKMMEEIKQAIKGLDVIGKQIEVQLLITEVSEKSFREFGFGNLEVTWGDGLEKLGEIFSVSIGPFTFGATSQNDLMSALNLRILSERGEAKITGSPKIRVLEGHEAYIKLGEERHIIPVIEKGTGTGFYTTYIEKEEVKAESGLIVNISRVTAENEIIFDSVEMNLEEILESVQRTVSGEIFRVNKRSAGTTLILRNYETMKVGSMLVQREKSLRRFPPYANSEKELVQLELYMTANVVGTIPPPEYKGLEKYVEGLEKLNLKPAKKRKRNPIITLLIIGAIAWGASSIK